MVRAHLRKVDGGATCAGSSDRCTPCLPAHPCRHRPIAITLRMSSRLVDLARSTNLLVEIDREIGVFRLPGSHRARSETSP